MSIRISINSVLAKNRIFEVVVVYLLYSPLICCRHFVMWFSEMENELRQIFGIIATVHNINHAHRHTHEPIGVAPSLLRFNCCCRCCATNIYLIFLEWQSIDYAVCILHSRVCAFRLCLATQPHQRLMYSASVKCSIISCLFLLETETEKKTIFFLFSGREFGATILPFAFQMKRNNREKLFCKRAETKYYIISTLWNAFARHVCTSVCTVHRL